MTHVQEMDNSLESFLDTVWRTVHNNPEEDPSFRRWLEFWNVEESSTQKRPSACTFQLSIKQEESGNKNSWLLTCREIIEEASSSSSSGESVEFAFRCAAVPVSLLKEAGEVAAITSSSPQSGAQPGASNFSKKNSWLQKNKNPAESESKAAETATVKPAATAEKKNLQEPDNAPPKEPRVDAPADDEDIPYEEYDNDVEWDYIAFTDKKLQSHTAQDPVREKELSLLVKTLTKCLNKEAASVLASVVLGPSGAGDLPHETFVKKNAANIGAPHRNFCPAGKWYHYFDSQRRALVNICPLSKDGLRYFLVQISTVIDDGDRLKREEVLLDVRGRRAWDFGGERVTVFVKHS